MRNNKPVRVIAVASGKGGVGKTNVVANMAVSFAKYGRKVMVLDADLGLGNIDVLLDLAPRFNLSHVVRGEKTLEEVLVEGPHGIHVVPAASGIQAMAELDLRAQAALVQSFGDLSLPLDILLIDTAAGISSSVLTFSLAAQEIIVVISNEPTSITDAYALIKVLSRDYGHRRFRLLANMVRDAQEGRELFNKILQVADRYLDVSLDLMGMIPFDAKLRRAVQHQRAVTDAFPNAPSTQAFHRLVTTAERWPMPVGNGGRLEFFMERLIAGSHNLLDEASA
ncbi:MinD/ParA family protein [Thermithiobacillus plumbiphilus]|uniref:MinD/ParA family protein n=1 Tax=Thermithiobacillus plumbiphilus TaxID=1729899 RepID=A0ABU9DAJ0_9PROT